MNVEVSFQAQNIARPLPVEYTGCARIAFGFRHLHKALTGPVLCLIKNSFTALFTEKN